jgi:ubiquinone/menaquinone biosynthesis C-methylase UbiE
VNFDYVARYYRWLETITFGNALQEARIYWIDKIPRPRRALIVGEGNGRFLCELLRIQPKIDVDCVDASGRMLELARGRVRRFHPKSLASVRFFHQDVLNWSPLDSYDLLVTHFFLDCFPREQVGAIVAKLAHVARPDAVWLVADFCIPHRKFARIHAKFWVRMMYAFFRVIAAIPAKELVDPTPYLQCNGFVGRSRKLSRCGMLRSDLYVAHSR